MFPIVYTPGVGDVCRNYGRITGEVGIILTITEPDKIEEKFRKWKESHPEVKAIVVTDGERILGLGDLGANGMGIPVGKMAIYSAMGGVHPEHCLPITLDVGTNNQEILGDNTGRFIGLKQKRTRGEEYDKFVDKFMKTAQSVFGQTILIQFEDFANENAFKFLDKYQKVEKYTMFNDDIQGTAAVAVAGVLAAERVSSTKLQDSKILFAGAGEAALGIAQLMVEAMMERGLSEEDARKRIYLKKSDRLITDLDTEKFKDDRKHYCHPIPAGSNINDFLEIIKWLKPNILIGASSVRDLFNTEVLQEMGQHDRPIVFALSNPTEKSECTAQAAYEHTQGKVMFASGSPFPPVTYKGKTYHPQQCNNAYIFPGVALGIVATQMEQVDNKVFLIAAETLAHTCTLQEDLDSGSMFPKLGRLRECSVEIATKIAEYAFSKGMTEIQPKPADLKQFIRDYQYTPNGLRQSAGHK